MKTYAMFIEDMEIHVTLKVGTLESLDSLREELIETIKGNPTLERGYAEQYPFYQAEWEVVGYGWEKPSFDMSTILEVN
jgi:hypothetical protein